MTAPAQWKKRGPSVFIEGQSLIDGVDLVAREMEARWGVGRLRLLVAADMRARFDNQRMKLNQAIWSGDLDDLQRESQRMINGWRALDAAATQAGCTTKPEWVFAEVTVDGVLIAIASDMEAAAQQAPAWLEGRKGQIWSVDEVGRVIAAFPAVVKAKHTFPGAEVVRTKPPSDPLLAIDMNDEIPFLA